MFFSETKLVAAGVGMTWRESRPGCLLAFYDTHEPHSMDSQQPDRHSYHTPVLLDEVIDHLRPEKNKTIVDGTLGGGGHSEALLKAGARVVGIDQDDEALDFARQRLAGFGEDFRALRGNFADMPELLADAGISRVDGILVDIGVSSRQLDQAERGFSFGKKGPLDMRMDRSRGKTAADLVNTLPEEELATIFHEYGEQRASRRIAERIVRRRSEKPFTTTTDLADFIAGILPRGHGPGGKIHPATRVFQALRIAVNDELGVLRRFLDNASRLLKPGGRLVVITFHSLEDRIVKQFLKHASQSHVDRKEWPEPRPNPDFQYRLLTRRPVIANPSELSKNKRSRSAKLRAAEKT